MDHPDRSPESQAASQTAGAPSEAIPEPQDRLAQLSRLAGGLAHEIKNPLSTMAINLALLEEDWLRSPGAANRAPNEAGAPAGQAAQSTSPEPAPREPTPREARSLKRVRTLKREVKRLESIVQDFLVYVRGGEVNRSLSDITRIIQEVLDFVEPENEAAGIRQHVDMEFGLPLVWVDETQIKQALINLAANARQAMPDGGEMLVRVRRLGNEVEISITDTGVGMSPEQLERCFDVYWSNKKGGTGLGLPTTYRIVEEHGGSLRALSEPERGTSFAITLPLAVELTRSSSPSNDAVDAEFVVADDAQRARDPRTDRRAQAPDVDPSDGER